jgi:putative transposase
MPVTNLLERLNEEIERRTHVVRIFPNAESCLRLVRALAVEMHENWLEAHRYLNMDDLREHKKEALRMAALPQTNLPVDNAAPCLQAHHRNHDPFCRRFWTQLPCLNSRRRNTDLTDRKLAPLSRHASPSRAQRIRLKIPLAPP